MQPMEMAIAADGRIFMIELAGLVKTIDPKSGKAEVVGKLEVTTAQENGLIGLALDPNFASNGWIYLQYSPPEFSGQRVSRFDFRNNAVDLSSEKILFTYEEQRRECCHHAGSMEFGPDGNLYIGTGDNTNPFNDSEGFAPLDEREGRAPWDAQRSAGNTKSYNGKILRIHPEANGTYSIPDGNLFPKDGSIGHPEIYVMGCRNPWRLNIDQRTGILYWGDVGPDAGSDGPRGPRGYDEVNQARKAGNYGWPYFIGKNRAYSLLISRRKRLARRKIRCIQSTTPSTTLVRESYRQLSPRCCIIPRATQRSFLRLEVEAGLLALAGLLLRCKVEIAEQVSITVRLDTVRLRMVSERHLRGALGFRIEYEVR